jgi:cytochrome P450
VEYSHFIQSESYNVLVGISQGKEIPSIVSTLNEAKHTAMKKGIGHAFTTNALLDYESYIDESAQELFHRFLKDGTCDISKWFQYFTMDVLSRIAFSESFGFVDKGADLGGTIKAIQERFDYWNDWAAIPQTERLIYRNPISKSLMKTGSNQLAALAVEKLQARKTAISPPPQRDLLQKYIEASEKNPEVIDTQTIIGMTMSTIAGGADTTAVTLTSVFYFLMKNPRTFDKLLSEFQTALHNGALSDPPRWSETHKLPYLEVVIKESMRCYPIATFGLDRVVPKGGAEVCGKFIPEGTVVSCLLYSVHCDKDVYGQDADQFRPERWLEADELQRRKMERGFIGFGAGKRICLGLHIAQLEMKKIIPYMMMKFKVRLRPLILRVHPMLTCYLCR